MAAYPPYQSPTFAAPERGRSLRIVLATVATIALVILAITSVVGMFQQSDYDALLHCEARAQAGSAGDTSALDAQLAACIH